MLKARKASIRFGKEKLTQSQRKGIAPADVTNRCGPEESQSSAHDTEKVWI